MKKIVLILTAAVALLSGCKRNEWLDWKVQNEVWLEQNKLDHKDDPNFHVSPSGLQYLILGDPNPTDAIPNSNNTVICTYTGTLINGAKFDGGTSTFQVSQLVPGFQEGLKRIHNKGVIRIYIPYKLAYGEDGTETTEGTSSFIPPYSTLIFDVYLDGIY